MSTSMLKNSIGQNVKPKNDVKTKESGEMSGFIAHRIMQNKPIDAHIVAINVSILLPNQCLFFILSFSAIKTSYFV